MPEKQEKGRKAEQRLTETPTPKKPKRGRPPEPLPEPILDTP